MSTLERHSLVIPDALDTLRSRCGEMEENQVLCRRVYERLRSIADELQGNQDERVVHSSDVPTPYSGLIKYFLYVLDAHHEKATLSRLTSSRTLTERLRGLHDGIDSVINLLNLEHSDKLRVQWEEDWEQDLTTHWGLLHHVVKNTELIRSELAGHELIEALTESSLRLSIEPTATRRSN